MDQPNMPTSPRTTGNTPAPVAPQSQQDGTRRPLDGSTGGIPVPTLRVPQARILRALMPEPIPRPPDGPATPPDADPVGWVYGPPSEWPTIGRAALGVEAGYTPISGSVTRALNGIREGSSSGDAHEGLIALGCVTVEVFDVDGLEETNYQITRTGIVAYLAFLARGGVLPPVKDASICTNERYRNNASAQEKGESS